MLRLIIRLIIHIIHINLFYFIYLIHMICLIIVVSIFKWILLFNWSNVKGALSAIIVIRYDWCLNKTFSVTYKCYEIYAHRGKIRQLLVFWDRSRNGRHLNNYRYCLRICRIVIKSVQQCRYFLFANISCFFFNLLLVGVNYGQRTMHVCS